MIKNTETVVAEKIKEKTDGRFEYVSGYVNKSKPVIVRCVACGETLEKTFHHLTTAKHIVCQHCIESSKYREEKKKEKERQEKQEQVAVKKICSASQVDIGICDQCGSLFIGRDSRQRFCSDECRKKHINRKKDKRINKYNTIDKDITLEKLYARDGGVCYICGCECNWNDKHTDGGTVLVGNSYPTIEHVQPLSHGGMHSWDNVKLACFRCNTLKSDNPPVPAVL